MAKYKKWLAGTLGWAFGGPIGGLIGFALGSMWEDMDRGSEAVKQVGRSTGAADFAASLMVLSAAVMKADGKMLKSELDFVKSFLIRQFGSEVAKQQTLLLREILKQEIPLRDVCLQIKHFMDHPARLQLLHYLFGIAKADGDVAHSELDVILRISKYLGVNELDFKSLKAMYYKDAESNYKILELDKSANDEAVKRAYRKMAIKYHPDKVAHLGVDVQKAANEKFQKVQEAYENIKKVRGIK